MLVSSAMAASAAREERWDTRLKRAYRRARRRTLELVVAAVTAYLLLFQTPLVWWLASPLKVSEPPRGADCIGPAGG